MTPDRVKKVGKHIIEEFYWAGKMVVYVDNRLTQQSFESACKSHEEMEEEYV